MRSLAITTLTILVLVMVLVEGRRKDQDRDRPDQDRDRDRDRDRPDQDQDRDRDRPERPDRLKSKCRTKGLEKLCKDVIDTCPNDRPAKLRPNKVGEDCPQVAQERRRQGRKRERHPNPCEGVAADATVSIITCGGICNATAHEGLVLLCCCCCSIIVVGETLVRLLDVFSISHPRARRSSAYCKLYNLWCKF
jgi:hypothetical protein